MASGMVGFFPRRRGWWRLVLLIVIIVSIIGYVSPVRSYISRSEQISIEKAGTSSLRQQHEQLQLEKERLQNQAYVEQVARKDLGLVKPGEQSYVLKNLDQDDEIAAATEPVQKDESFFSRVLDAAGSLLP
jgi:cell division protein FtsL